MQGFTRLLSMMLALSVVGCAKTYDIYLPNGQQVTAEQVRQWQEQKPAPILPYQLGKGDLDSTFMWAKGNAKRRTAVESQWVKNGATPTSEIAAPVMQGWFEPGGGDALDLYISNIGYKGIGYNPDGVGDLMRSVGNLVTLGLVSSRRHDSNYWELQLKRGEQPVFQSDLPITVRMQRGWFANGTFKNSAGEGIHFYDAWVYSVLQSQHHALASHVAAEQEKFAAALKSVDVGVLAAAVNSPDMRILRLGVENRLLEVTANSSDRIAVLAGVMDYAEFIAPQLSEDDRLLLTGPTGYTVFEILQQLESVSAADVAAQISARELPYADFNAAEQGQLRRLGLPDRVMASMIETTQQGHQNLVVACTKGYAAVKVCQQTPSDPFGLIKHACMYTVKRRFGEFECPVPLF